MRRSPRARERGSVLIDALVAIGVMTVTLVMAAQTLGDGARRTAAGERSRLALLEARSRLAEVGGDIPLVVGDAQGVDGDMVWRVDIAPGPPTGGAAGVGLLQVTVAVSDRGGPELATLRTLRLGAAT